MAQSYKYQPFYRDLSGKKPVSRMDITLNSILDKLSQYVQIEEAKKDKMALNVVENLVRSSGQYNTDNQFEIAFNSLEAVRDQLDGPVSDALIDTHFNHLNREYTNYKADSAIIDMINDNMVNLKKLDELNWTTEVIPIMDSLKAIQESYRKDASENVIASLDKHIGDVGDALHVVELLDEHAIKTDDISWNFERDNLLAKHAADRFLQGDFKGAQAKLEKLEYDEHQAKWDHAAEGYENIRREYNILISSGMRTEGAGGFLNDATRHTGLFKDARKENVTGSSKLDALQINSERQRWNDQIVSNLLRDDVTLHSQLKKKLMDGDSVDKIYNYILSDEGAGVNAKYYEVIEWIEQSNVLIPGQKSVFGFKGKDQRVPKANEYAAELLWKQLKIHQLLFEQIDKLDVWDLKFE